ncbi:MAG: ParA family protein, partial [Candidatus Viridilinea halotolerans]
MELMIYTTMDGLSSRLETTYPDLSVIAPSRIDQARRLLAGDRPPDALYVDDSRGTALPDLWGLIQAAHQAQVTVLVNM